MKLRSSQTRAARFRMAGMGLSMVFALVVILFVFWRGGEWVLNCLIYKNEAFAIRQIEVETDGVIAAEHFRHWAMVKPGQNLLALDLARVKRDLELVPYVRSAAIERALPRTLRLRFSEREPIAQVVTMQLGALGAYEQVIYHLDETGFVMTPLHPRFRAAPIAVQIEPVPIISGINPRDVRPGRRLESLQVRAALELIVQFDRSPMAGLAELQRVNVATPEVLEVFTSQGSQITFSLNPFVRQLNRWRLIYDQFQKQGKAIATLDLSIANEVPLRLVEAIPIPPSQTKPVKTTRPRKKNV
ncbi:MAG: FtsQ-type POTRA domain-containing protein [Verrucomicrobiota bacterium]